MAFSHGSHIQLECMEGFQLEGRDLLTCTNQGWNPPQLGTCTQVNPSFFTPNSSLHYSIEEEGDRFILFITLLYVLLTHYETFIT